MRFACRWRKGAIPTTLLLGKDQELKDLKARLKAHKAMVLKLIAPISFAIPLSAYCGNLSGASQTNSGPALYAVWPWYRSHSGLYHGGDEP